MDVLIGWPGGDWQATARLAGMLVFGYLTLIWFAALIWIYRDISSRTREPVSQIVSLGIGVVLPVIGIPIYMALRPSETLQQAYDREIEQEAILADIQTAAACPSCGRPAETTFRICAYCGTSLKDPCQRCSEPMLHAWRFCPYCATPRGSGLTPPRLDFSVGDDLYDKEPRAHEPRTPAPSRAAGTSGGSAVRRRLAPSPRAEADPAPARITRPATED